MQSLIEAVEIKLRAASWQDKKPGMGTMDVIYVDDAISNVIALIKQHEASGVDDFEKWYNENGYYHDTVSERKELMQTAWQAARSPHLKQQQPVSTAVDIEELRAAIGYFDEGWTQWREEKELVIEAARAYLKLFPAAMQGETHKGE